MNTDFNLGTINRRLS